MTRNPGDGQVNIGLFNFETVDAVNGGLDKGLSRLFAGLCCGSNRRLAVSVDNTLFGSLGGYCSAYVDCHINSSNLCSIYIHIGLLAKVPLD